MAKQNKLQNPELEISTPDLVQKPSTVKIEDKELTSYDVLKSLFSAYGEGGNDAQKAIFQKDFKIHLNQLVQKSSIADKYHFIILYDNSTMLKSDADKIYDTVTTFDKNKPVLMVLLSTGGVPGSAYLIGKLCREYSNGNLIIVVPRYAKSAATLLCCAANEIHMGSLSELGPIDPQIDNLPTLGLKNSVEHIAQLVAENPDSAEMFAKYLNMSIQPIQIGYYERVAESLTQYAENLLNTHSENLPKAANLIANELVYKYKDHGFVIDKSEAEKILGDKIVKHNTIEYEFGNTVYQYLEFLRKFARYTDHSLYFIGGLNSDPTLIESK